MKPTLTEADFERAADALDCDVAAIKAVCEVEAPRGGFLANDEPRILFEAHHFARLTGNAYNESHPNISSATWNRALYATGPNADVRGMKEHVRLQEAVALHRNAALQSASWGKFQVMCFNHKAAGHDTVQSFIDAAYRSEGDHLDMFIAFVITQGLGGFLRSHEWANFAARYNGASYKENFYDTKLATAWSKHGGTA